MAAEKGNAAETPAQAAEAYVRRLVDEHVQATGCHNAHIESMVWAGLRALDGLATSTARFHIARQTGDERPPSLQARMALMHLPPLTTAEELFDHSLAYLAVTGGAGSTDAELADRPPPLQQALPEALAFVASAKSVQHGALTPGSGGDAES